MTELSTILTKKTLTNEQKATPNHPRISNISWYFPVKNFQESTGSSYKTGKEIGKGSAAGKSLSSVTDPNISKIN